MDILENLQKLLEQGAAPQSNARAQGQGAGGGADGLGGLLDSNMLGGLLGALLGGKGAASGMSGAAADSGGLGAIGGLLGALMGGGQGVQGSQGGGGLLQQILGGLAAPGSQPAPAPAVADPRKKAENLIRALVYAAKADGHIDAGEQAAITDQIAKLGLGQQAKALVDQAMQEPLDPNRIANNVTDANEGIQLYALSCAITNMDQFMEKNYLDALANALGIPAQAKAAVESRITGR